ncbi:hypothetical protein [Microbacterium gorillae]|uniref:hypothetical protein n=1 Tax=Microbacterium gorillae TaxID=1231063 RepID=UPI003D985CEE
MSALAVAGIVQAGIVLPEGVLNSAWFAVLAGFVAVNTVVYVCLAIFKMLPPPRWRWRGRSRRSETRSIHPDGPV